MTKELSKGFTGIEINGVRFSNISEMLQYMDKQRERITELEKENAELKEKLEMGIALKDEEIGCIQTDFNTFKSKAKELHKANEWHYVKDGDLPPLNTNVLVIHRWARTPEVGKRIEVFINSSVWVWAMCSDRYRYTSDDENVIAWKEIVLPNIKEIKEK